LNLSIYNQSKANGILTTTQKSLGTINGVKSPVTWNTTPVKIKKTWLWQRQFLNIILTASGTASVVTSVNSFEQLQIC
jgi:hypothetical protein